MSDTQTQINIFIDENLPAETPQARAKALRKFFKIVANATDSGEIQTVRNLKLSQLLEDSAHDIESSKTLAG